MKTIAIVGAGFCGLSLTWELLKLGCCVHLYDAREIGTSTSGISAGLLHPFSGIRAKLASEGREGMAATRALLSVASQALGIQVFEESGMLRLATTEEMVADFKRCAKQFSEVSWLSVDECLERVPFVAPFPGIWISNALNVHSPLYLKGLWKACEALGAHFIQKKIDCLDSLTQYDQIVLAVGAEMHAFSELKNLGFTPIKGQVLELAWPTDLPALPFPLNSHAYLLMNPHGRSCLAGATFERHFTSPEPDLAQALNDIMPKVAALIPRLKNAPPLSCRAGMRASTAGHLPLLKQMTEKIWILGGMGSKGLLYHALYARKLAESII